MREYGQVQCAFWGHPDIAGLSIEAKLMAVYLLTGPHSNGLGCYRLPAGYILEDLGMDSETVSKGFRELFDAGFAKRCERTKFVLMPKFLRWNPIANANVAKARAKEFEEVPSQFQYIQELACVMLEQGEHWPEQFRNRLETLSKPDPTRPDPDPTLIQTPTRAGADEQGAHEPSAPPPAKTNGNGKSQPRTAERFDDFWAIYPSRRGKKRAREIWLQKNLDARADQILHDVRERQRRDERWLNGYIPNPTTYLNQERWEDDYSDPGAQAGGEDWVKERARQAAEARAARMASAGGEQS